MDKLKYLLVSSFTLMASAVLADEKPAITLYAQGIEAKALFHQAQAANIVESGRMTFETREVDGHECTRAYANETEKSPAREVFFCK